MSETKQKIVVAGDDALADAICGTMGYMVEESMVFVKINDNNLFGFTARLDIPDYDDLAEGLSVCFGHMLNNGTERMLIVIFSDDVKRGELIRKIADAMSPVTVLQSLAVRNARRVSDEITDAFGKVADNREEIERPYKPVDDELNGHLVDAMEEGAGDARFFHTSLRASASDPFEWNVEHMANILKGLEEDAARKDLMEVIRDEYLEVFRELAVRSGNAEAYLLCGIIALSQGNGLIARVATNYAMQIDPHDPLTLLFEKILDEGIDPEKAVVHLLDYLEMVGMEKKEHFSQD